MEREHQAVLQQGGYNLHVPSYEIQALEITVTICSIQTRIIMQVHRFTWSGNCTVQSIKILQENSK